ncbi:MAG: hypothetical protein ACI89X_001816 [Planctomycetota bacterium]|jgi:hypothetical protein
MNRHVDPSDDPSDANKASLAATRRVSIMTPMKMSFLAAISLWLIGCTVATTGAANDDADRAQVEDQWALVMQELDDACKDINKRLLRQPAGDLNAVAARAQAAAKQISLGYGSLDHKYVPGFASMSRDCESWFLQIAIEAKNGRRGIAADLYSTGRMQHCARCHEAHEAIK